MTSIRRALTVATAAAGAVVLATTPAEALPNWQPWHFPQTQYDCETTTPSHISTKVVGQTCVVWNDKSVQGVLLVRNNATVNIKLDAGRIAWYDKNGNFLHSSYCTTEKIVQPGELTACYGQSIPSTILGNKVRGQYLYNGSYNDTVAETW
ncbi:hypothetical protein [Streptomyces cinereoruber]|uniref:hypothetical protein n=1 Tax=Streptomyces cinereoruber TaxID=67260 RepID=UPI0036325301